MAVHAWTLESTRSSASPTAIANRARGQRRQPVEPGPLESAYPAPANGEAVSAFPYVLMLGQDDNERIMGDHLTDWGIDVHWNTELVALEQDASQVTATSKSGRPHDEITAAYVAGCDGARSPVREMRGIKFPGEPYEHVFFVADTEAAGSMVPDELNVYLWRYGFISFFPMRGTDRWRVIGILPNTFEKNRMSPSRM